MLFNTFDFAVFLPIVFTIYWLTQRHIKLRNLVIVISSYLFYGWWDWRFLFLIFLSTTVDYFIGRGLSSQDNIFRRKVLLWISLFVNLGILGFFKYYNFFLNNFISAFSFLGKEINANSLNIILPVGISFYTFQTLSYTLDIYKRKLESTKDFLAFSAFVSFFPQLVAGPIVRATHLLPQFSKKRSFNYDQAADGLRQIIWGLFKKMVIADNCAEFANLIFNNPSDYSGSTLLLGAFFFSFQIYGDFSGYSDIAIGLAKLFGFDLMRNFAHPYFSRDIAEFWRRWHISLSTWFRDYLYIPLGGSKGRVNKKIRNIFIIFIVSGFWHGANWTFIIWGGINALYFLPLLIQNKNRRNIDIVAKDKSLPSIKELLKMCKTFGLVSLAWIIFRAENIRHALSYLSGIFSKSVFSIPDFVGLKRALSTFLLVIILILIEWYGRKEQHTLAHLDIKWRRPFRWIFYYVVVVSIFFFTAEGQQFIYFQF